MIARSSLLHCSDIPVENALRGENELRQSKGEKRDHRILTPNELNLIFGSEVTVDRAKCHRNRITTKQ